MRAAGGLPLRPGRPQSPLGLLGRQWEHGAGCSGQVPWAHLRAAACPQTQPVPNPVAYFLHRSPWWFHRFETLSNHFLELLVPFFVFLGRRMCIIHGTLQVLFQVSSRATENLSSHVPSATPVGVDPQGPRRPTDRAPIFLLLGVGARVLICPRHGLHGTDGGRGPTAGGSLWLGWLLTVAASTKFSCFLFTRSFVLFALDIFSHEWVRFSKNATTVSYLPRMNQTQVMLCICQHIPGYTCYHFVWVFHTVSEVRRWFSVHTGRVWLCSGSRSHPQRQDGTVAPTSPPGSGRGWWAEQGLCGH